MTREQLEAVIRSLTLLLAAYETSAAPVDLDKVESESYTLGFHNGARSAYADAVCRLRELTAGDVNVTRIGAVS